jgi:flagellar L-ring protein precursor FlgH
MNRLHRLIVPGLVFVGTVAGASAARGQSLLEDPPTEAIAAPGLVNNGGTTVAEQLQGVSLFAVVPPKPKTYAKHDLIEIIINETSAAKMEQTLDTKKDYNFDGALTDFPSIQSLLEFQLNNGDSTSLPVKFGVGSKNKFKGDGEFERKDNLTARVTATVIDVKPNGTLVLEARKSRQQNEETYTLVLAGVCRGEDITKQNTIQSSQLADLDVKIESEGQVDKAGKKGFIPRIFEAIFNF